MTRRKEGSRFWRVTKRLLLAVVLIFTIREAYLAIAPDPEIALIIGEPWEDMRARSTASISPAIPGHIGYQLPKTQARLRLVDPKYGFTTPKARFLGVGFDDDRVDGLRISPQVEPLLLDDAVKVLMDLQDQWRAGGWTEAFPDEPAFTDTPEWRHALRTAPNGIRTMWEAGDKLQARLIVHRFTDDRHPDQERYLITISLARPWLPSRLSSFDKKAKP